MQQLRNQHIQYIFVPVVLVVHYDTFFDRFRSTLCTPISAVAFTVSTVLRLSFCGCRPFIHGVPPWATKACKEDNHIWGVYCYREVLSNWPISQQLAVIVVISQILKLPLTAVWIGYYSVTGTCLPFTEIVTRSQLWTIDSKIYRCRPMFQLMIVVKRLLNNFLVVALLPSLINIPFHCQLWCLQYMDGAFSVCFWSTSTKKG